MFTRLADGRFDPRSGRIVSARRDAAQRGLRLLAPGNEESMIDGSLWQDFWVLMGIWGPAHLVYVGVVCPASGRHALEARPRGGVY